MKSNLVFSSALHIIFIAALFVLRPGKQKFEGYPTIIPVELVQIKPVSFKAPEVEAIEPRREEPKPQPKLLEGITVEKIPEKKEPEERQPEQKEQPEKSDEGKSVVEGDKVRLDVEEFPFSYYLALLRSRIKVNWEPPMGSSQNLSRKAIVYFKIQRNGHVIDIVLENGSGDYLFDQAALRAVTLASPLPPLPADFSQRDLGVHFEFEQGR